MFFNIKKSVDSSYTNNFQLTKTMWLNCDAGWLQFKLGKTSVYAKGYVDNSSLANIIDNLVVDPTPRHSGNFLAIIVSNNKLIITHDKHRGTPINIETELASIHNFKSPTAKPVWANEYLTVTDNFEISTVKFDPIGEIEYDCISESDAVDLINRQFIERYTEFFKHNTLPVKWFPSGGIDGCTVGSYLNRLNVPYETCSFEHFDFTKFTCQHRYDLHAYWSYNQIHHWTNPCVLVTGGSGDENFLRGPATVHMLCLHYGIDLETLLDPGDYHYTYFLNEKNRKIYEHQRHDKMSQALIKRKDLLYKNILLKLLHDHQHWHLENTLTFTPFKDIEFSKILIRLHPDDLIKQFKNAEFNRHLVKINDPSLLDIVSKQKNTNEKENVWKLFKKD